MYSLGPIYVTHLNYQFHKRILNILIDYSSLNIYSPLLLHFSQIIETTTDLSKIYDALGFLNLSYYNT